ncbi:MAG: fibronectin type III domain-containing protein [Melioribacteraceae bacterium]|nr:fibronectin type III domain-containing protein [Melioribacteraceae bacterium]MCF8263773.1 fibronectin type III domain-containing protein [Melioribacteraceae bacterium]
MSLLFQFCILACREEEYHQVSPELINPSKIEISVKPDNFIEGQFVISVQIVNYKRYDEAEIRIDGTRDTTFLSDSFSYEKKIPSINSSGKDLHEVYVKLLADRKEVARSESIFILGRTVAPTNLTVSAIYDTAFAISWDEHTRLKFRYLIQLSINNGKWKTIAETDSFEDSLITPYPLINRNVYQIRLATNYSKMLEHFTYADPVRISVPSPKILSFLNLADTAFVLERRKISYYANTTKLLINFGQGKDSTFIIGNNQIRDTVHTPRLLGKYSDGENIGSQTYTASLIRITANNKTIDSKSITLNFNSPTNIRLEDHSDTGFTIKWKKDDLAQKYIIYRNENDSPLHISDSTTVTEYIVSSPNPKNKYTYQIRGKSKYNTLRNSMSVSAIYSYDLVESWSYYNSFLGLESFSKSGELMILADMEQANIQTIIIVNPRNKSWYATHRHSIYVNLPSRSVEIPTLVSMDENSGILALVDILPDGQRNSMNVLSFRDLYTTEKYYSIELPRIGKLFLMQNDCMVYNISEAGEWQYDIISKQERRIVRSGTINGKGISFNPYHGMFFSLKNSLIEIYGIPNFEKLADVLLDNSKDLLIINQQQDQFQIVYEDGQIEVYNINGFSIEQSVDTGISNIQSIQKIDKNFYMIVANDKLILYSCDLNQQVNSYKLDL